MGGWRRPSGRAAPDGTDAGACRGAACQAPPPCRWECSGEAGCRYLAPLPRKAAASRARGGSATGGGGHQRGAGGRHRGQGCQPRTGSQDRPGRALRPCKPSPGRPPPGTAACRDSRSPARRSPWRRSPCCRSPCCRSPCCRSPGRGRAGRPNKGRQDTRHPRGTRRPGTRRLGAQRPRPGLACPDRDRCLDVSPGTSWTQPEAAAEWASCAVPHAPLTSVGRSTLPSVAGRGKCPSSTTIYFGGKGGRFRSCPGYPGPAEEGYAERRSERFARVVCPCGAISPGAGRRAMNAPERS
jgi:hypothetical protein